MANKKKKYNAKFPPARVKKIMQKDEEVGKVAAAVPVIIARALEFFVMDLMSKANERILSKNAKTLTPEHIKQTVHMVEEFSFLKELVANISDVPTSNNSNNQTQAPKQTSKQKHESKQEMKTLKQESSSLSCPTNDETLSSKVPSRGRPRKLKSSSEEISPKRKKMKKSQERSKGGDDKQVFQVTLPDIHGFVEASNSYHKTPLSPPFPSLPISLTPQASGTHNHILFQPSLEQPFINNHAQLSTSIKIADALNAVNNNNNNQMPNNSTIDANVLNNNYNFNNNPHAESLINASIIINNNINQDFNPLSLPHTNSTTITSITFSSNNKRQAHLPTDLSHSSARIFHLDEVLDLSKQSNNHEGVAEHVARTFPRNHPGDLTNNTSNSPSLNKTTNIFANNNGNNANIFFGNTNNNNNNNNSSSFSKNNTSDINMLLSSSSSAENRSSEMYKLNVPNLNSFYHRSTSSS